MGYVLDDAARLGHGAPSCQGLVEEILDLIHVEM
jgi:hypothetical protein